MSFVEMVPQSAGGRPLTFPVRVGLTDRHLAIVLTKTKVAELGWKAGSRIAIGLGVGAHAGKIRLMPAARGYKMQKTSPHHAATRITLPRWAELPTGLRAPREVAYLEIEDGDARGLEITIPYWGKT